MPVIYLKTPEELVKYIKDYSTSLLVVDFFAEWCQPCKFIGKKFEEEWLPMYGDKLVLVKVDSDNAALESLNTQFKVRGIPRLIFYHNQKIVDDITGADVTAIKGLCDTYCGSTGSTATSGTTQNTNKIYI